MLPYVLQLAAVGISDRYTVNQEQMLIEALHLI